MKNNLGRTKGIVNNSCLVAVVLLASILLFSCTRNNAHPPDQFANVASTPAGFLRNSVTTQNTVFINVVKDSGGATVDRDTLSVSVQITSKQSKDISGVVAVNEGLLASYNIINNTAYKILPAAAYTLTGGTISIPQGATMSARVAFKLTNADTLMSGVTYLLPVSLSLPSVDGLTVDSSFSTVYVVVAAGNKPMFPSTEKGPNGIKSVLYIEINGNSPLNAGRYVMKTSGKPLFDFVFLFAAAIGWQDKKPFVAFGPGGPLSNVEKYIRPLQQKGIKVMVSFLGPTANYTAADIEDLSQQIKALITRYGLDGINFDDEYASYDGISMPVANDSSVTLLLKRCKELMPDKVVSLYVIGNQPQVVGDIIPGNYLDYAWQAFYGSFYAPNIPGLTDNKKLGPGAFWIGNSGQSFSGSLAQQTVDGGYGVLVYYDLTASTNTDDLQDAALALYGDSVITVSDPFQKDW